MGLGAVLNPPELGGNSILSPGDRCAAWNPKGGWKRGGDRFCTPNPQTDATPGGTYPYFMSCPKQGSGCVESYDSDGDGTDDSSITVPCSCKDADGDPNFGAGSPGVASEWADDKLDRFVYGVPDFIYWAKKSIETPVTALNAAFDEWYNEAAYWIEPLCPDPHCDPDICGTAGNPPCDPNCPRDFRCPASLCPGKDCPDACKGLGAQYKDRCPGSYTKKIRDLDNNGIIEAANGEEDWSNLAEWRKDFRSFDTPIASWISAEPASGWKPTVPDPALVVNHTPSSAADVVGSYVGFSCATSSTTDGVWCVPPAQATPNEYGIGECPCVTQDEAETFDSNNNGVRGDLGDVISCLDYNANHPFDGVHVDSVLGTMPVTVHGNYERFNLCATDCNDTNCQNLPRSLTPPATGCSVPYVDVATSCVPGSPFMTWVTQSAVDAQVQVEKMKKRLNILANLLQDALNIAYIPPDLDPDNPYTSETPKVPDGGDDHDLSDKRFFGFNGETGIGTVSPIVAPPAEGGVLGQGIIQFTRFLDNDTPFYDPNLPTEIFAKAFDPITNRHIQDSPVERLIDARIREELQPPLPAVAVYAWRDANKPGQTAEGRWHVVQTEVRTPQRCNNACGIAINGVPGVADPRWPRVRTYTTSMGMMRCYELVDTTGMVKVRVIRYDDDRTWNPLRFAGIQGNTAVGPEQSKGIPLWNVRLFHPARQRISATDLLSSTSGIGEFCLEQVDPRLIDPGTGRPFPWGYAFMLNQRPDYTEVDDTTDKGKYKNCWTKVHLLLENGVQSESCAMYYYSNGMQIKFIDCDPNFKNGKN
jgi:hypothetical protein